jgi:hypothetical protein
MDWATLKAGFRDELSKISEVNLAGLSAETLMNYPQREPMPSAAYEKAQAILAKVQPGGAEKTAGPRPDVLPMFKRLTRRKENDPPPTKSDKALNYGGHVLAGTGAAKFVGDAAETGMSAVHTHLQRKGGTGFKVMNEKFTEGKLPARYKAGILGAGAALGLAHKLRKEHRRKQWQGGNPT